MANLESLAEDLTRPNPVIRFKKAEKKQTKLRLAITGPSGSGKTYSALQIASGIGNKIALIDTENHSASLYADEFSFDTREIDPPYTITKYIEAIQAAVLAGYDVLIIDSITHAWAGEGGLLAKKEALDNSNRGNSFTNWGSISKEHEQFKGRLLNCDVHLITTIRSKQDYVLQSNEKGQSIPKKIGLAPIQRDGIEYEFSLVLDMGMDHNASVSKTRIKSFDGSVFRPNKKTGETLLAWLMQGKKEEPNRTSSATLLNLEERKEIFRLIDEKRIHLNEFKRFIQENYGTEKTDDIRSIDYPKVIEWIIRSGITYPDNLATAEEVETPKE